MDFARLLEATIFKKIEHGDEEHRRWLNRELEREFAPLVSALAAHAEAVK